ncbi:MAG: tetratricopeptide repeat protein [Janthinobacterium lividum]
MNFRSMRRTATAAALSSFLVLAGLPVVSHAADALRAEVARPLNEAQTLYRAHNYRGALAKVAQAAAVPGKTSYETRVIEEMQGAAAMAAGDTGVAATAYEALLASGGLDAASAQQFSAALAGIYFQQKNFAAAIRTAQRYQKAGGSDPQIRELLLQSYFLSGDCGSVVATLRPGVEAALKGGHAPAESQLQILAECAQKTQNDSAQAEALVALVAYYPKPAYQERFFDAVRARPGYFSSLDLDIYRLRRATGTLTTADQYMEMTQLALVAGIPAEAKQVIDQGFASGALGHDAQAEREKRLQALVTRRLQGAADANNLPVAPLDGALNLVFAGQVQQGISASVAAAGQGGAHPDLARLRLGEAYYYAGQKSRAAQVFGTVKGNDGSADLARLWVLVADSHR